MKTYLTATLLVTSALLVVAPFFAEAATVSADVNVRVGSTTLSAALETRITTGKNRADQEITRRITALKALETRVAAMVHVSASDKSTLSANIESQVSTLTDLQTKIDADTDLATLKTDIQSITKSYRIFLLILPQGRSTAAADRISDVAGLLTTLAGKLQTRISATTGDTAALSADLADMNAKIADANVQASAAITEVATLTPDNGDSTVAASNESALKDARTKIQAGIKDLIAARADAGTIVKGLKALNAGATATTSAQAD